MEVDACILGEMMRKLFFRYEQLTLHVFFLNRLVIDSRYYVLFFILHIRSKLDYVFSPPRCSLYVVVHLEPIFPMSCLCFRIKH